MWQTFSTGQMRHWDEVILNECDLLSDRPDFVKGRYAWHYLVKMVLMQLNSRLERYKKTGVTIGMGEEKVLTKTHWRMMLSSMRSL